MFALTVADLAWAVLLILLGLATCGAILWLGTTPQDGDDDR